ncbi:riboflavin synthase alpha chain [Neolewinella xylanilytica]|uniref:Riboflavin synthase n=1 Tax=Neolewinella xylanilytica TaxID=1514080 RepID=A0A2S6I677_9BACT|nr:riboflavin synthase [Neolewinella xylanilytica]PPK86657.1 riboflavin synthase alpha chain [Neolewinella xylanilytica]
MFTGIIEAAGSVVRIEREADNVHFTVASPISDDLKIDQSLAHDGVCLTVVAKADGTHTVTAIRETLNRTRLAEWTEGSEVNLERAMQAGARLDGHIVQGHVDTVGECVAVEEAGGSWYYTIRYDSEDLLVDKGSVCVNGVSLTVVEPDDDSFKVAIIPYTYAHTNFKNLRPGDRVNLEFDILGKYIARHMAAYRTKVRMPS